MRWQWERIYYNWNNPWSVPIEYSYHRDGKMNFQNYRSGVQTLFGYDGRGFTSMVRNFFPSSGQELSRRDYYRDERDRIVAVQKGSGNPTNPMEDGRGDHYWYDAEGQLTDAYYGAVNPVTNPQSPVRSDSFHYDELGNRTGWNYLANRSAWSTFDHKDNGLNQYFHGYSLVQYDDDIGNGWGSPQHANGVMMMDGNITGGYNALNQPMMIWSANNPGGKWLWFGFDPLGRCVKRWYAQADGSAPGAATYFAYDGWNLVQEGYSPWSASRFYIHGSRVDEIVQSYNSGTGLLAYHYYDASGHCTMLTDTQGTIKEQYSYDAFGFPHFYNSTAQPLNSSTFGNRFLFTGREWLSELRLYDFRNRLYNPELGRFLQPDPTHFAAGDYNLYRYCHNDPINRTDPFGLLEYRFAKDYPDKGPGKREIVKRAIEKELRRTEEGRKILNAEGVVTIHPVDEKHPKTSTSFNLNPKIKDFDTYLDATNSRFQDAATFRALSKHPGELPEDSDKGRATIIGHEFAHGVFKVLDEIRTIREHENLIRGDPSFELPLRRSSGGDAFRP